MSSEYIKQVNDAIVCERINQRATKLIFVTFQREGIHRYPEAATNPALSDVSFLAHPHRHMFHFRVSIQVTENNREIEFIQFKRWLEGLYSAGTLELDYKSCEMLADELFVQIATKYPNRKVVVEISEDGENGAVIEYNA
jgi:hypothetical protein